MPSGICVLGKRSGIDLQGRLRHSGTIGQGTLPLPGVSALSLSGTPDSTMGLVKHHPQNRDGCPLLGALACCKGALLRALRPPQTCTVSGSGFQVLAPGCTAVGRFAGCRPHQICPSPQHACLRLMPQPQTLNRTR